MIKLLIGLLIFSPMLNAQGNLCAMNPDQTEKILEQLENRLLCQTLPIADCIKLFAGGAVVGVGGVLAAKKLLKLGQLGLKPETDIICSAKPETFTFHQFLFSQLVPIAEAKDFSFCQLHPGASYRSEVENLTRAMSQEINQDIQGLLKTSDSNTSNEIQQAKKQLADTTEDYLARFKLIKNEEAQRIFPSVERQIREAATKGDYATVRAHIKNSIKHLDSKGVSLGSVSPDLETFRSQIEVASKTIPAPSLSCAKDIQTLLDRNSTNDSFVKTELESMKKKCPSLNVNELTKKVLAVNRKRTALSLATYEKLGLEFDMNKLSRGHKNDLASNMKKRAQESAVRLNRISLAQFESPEMGLTAGQLEKWGRGLGLSATNLHSFAKTARALTPMALLAGGKAALASTGVGALPVIAETALEEAALQSVTFKPEECLAQEIQSPRNRNASPQTKLGYHYLNFDLKNCQSSLELSPQLAQFLQLSPQDRSDILGSNDKLCYAIHGLFDKENKLANFEASCIDDKGGFKLRDLQAEKGNFKLIQQRSREARDAKLVGDDYEKYVRGNLVSRDQIVTRNQNSMSVTYTSPVSQLSKCSKFDINLNNENQSFTNSCTSLTQPVLSSVYDYAMLSAQCSGVSQAYSEVYGKNFKKDVPQNHSRGVFGEQK